MPKITTKRDDEIMSLEEVTTMINNAKNERDKALIAFLYLFGCRISEALRLKREKVWFDDTSIYAKIYVLKREKKRQDGTKKESSFEHDVKIAKESPFVNIIQTWVESREPGVRIWHYSDNPNSDRVLAWKAIKKSNPKSWPHLFRHTRATRLAEEKASEMQLMTWMGWSDARPAKDYVSRTSTLIEELGKKVK